MHAETGTSNDTYNLIAVLYHALQGVENCERYQKDASQDEELRQFFDQAGALQRQIAEQGKALLADCLDRDGGGDAERGGSAFRFASQSADDIGQQRMGSATGATGMGANDEMAGGASAGMGREPDRA